MKVTIQYRGQLATAAGRDREEREVEPGQNLRSLIGDLAESGGGGFADIARDSDGRVRRTLLVAVDGEQVVDLDAPLGEGIREIMLLPPISGG